MPKILTVLIPTYNNNESLKKVLDSYIDDKRIEILVSDDSDNEDKKMLIKAMCKKANIIYFDGPKSSPAENWNMLIKMAKAPFFVLNHHDDYPVNLDFLNELDKDKLGLMILPCSSKPIGKKIRIIESWQQYLSTKVCSFFKNGSLNMVLAPTASIIINKRFKNILFDPKLKWFVDAEWYLKLFKTVKINKLMIRFYPFSRIFSIQLNTSLTISLSGILREQIKNEKRYLYSKKLYPGNFINFFQFSLLGIILLKTKLKQILSL